MIARIQRDRSRAFLGFEQGLLALLWTFVLGGAAGLAVLVWNVGFTRLVGGALRHLLWTLKLGGWMPLSEEERAHLQPALYLAPMAVVAEGTARAAISGRARTSIRRS